MNDGAINDAIELLRSHGYIVTAPAKLGRWVRPAFFRAEYRIGSPTLCKRLRAKGCPPFLARRGPSGRILWLFATEELRTFLTQPLTFGRLVNVLIS